MCQTVMYETKGSSCLSQLDGVHRRMSRPQSKRGAPRAACLAAVVQSPAPVTSPYDTPASLFRFARRDEYELIPRRICNAFRQTVVFEHSTCTYVLKGKDAETI